MTDFAEVMRWVNEALYVGLAVIAVVQWRRRRGSAAAWVAATFGLLAGVMIVGSLLPETGGGLLAGAVRRMLLAALVTFPYCLYRFAAEFEPVRRRIDQAAMWSTAFVIVAGVAIPRYPQPGEPRGWLVTAYVLCLLAQWTFLSLFVSVRLWRAGRGKPTVARRRMRLLGLAALLLNVALVVAGLAPSSADPAAASRIVTQFISTLSAVLFAVAFVPPGWMRLAWRRPEERALQAAQLELMAATTLPDVIERMLPPVVGVVGAVGAAVYDDHGHLQGAFPVGMTTSPQMPGDSFRVALRHGELRVWAGTHTPYFGREELELLGSFGAVVDLAWARCLLLERERDDAERLSLVNAALEGEIAERRAALDRLALSEQRLQEAQRLAHIGAFEWDPGTDAVVWSAEMFRIYGLAEGPVPTTDQMLDHIHPDDREALRAAVTATVDTGAPFRMDYRIVWPDGTVRIVDAQGRRRDEGGGSVRMLGTIQDITERKEAADAVAAAYEAERAARIAFERTNEELESFVYSVSHDLKSPIISLLGYLDYLKLDFGDQLPEEALHYVARMSASASYMEALIQDLLELSRIGRVQTDPEEVDLADLVTEVVTELGVAHPMALVGLGPLPVLHANPLRVRQLVTNLIGNAMEHGGRPEVRVVVAGYDCSDGSVRVEVTDDGEGIPEEYRERVFGVFERLPRPGSPDGGTGIGLAICKKFMESIGGSVTAEARGGGATMVLTFPASVVRRPVGAKTEVTA